MHRETSTSILKTKLSKLASIKPLSKLPSTKSLSKLMSKFANQKLLSVFADRKSLSEFLLKSCLTQSLKNFHLFRLFRFELSQFKVIVFLIKMITLLSEFIRKMLQTGSCLRCCCHLCSSWWTLCTGCHCKYCHACVGGLAVVGGAVGRGAGDAEVGQLQCWSTSLESAA